MAKIVLHAKKDNQDLTLTLTDDTPNLDCYIADDGTSFNWNDEATSCTVYGGTWLLYKDTQYGGDVGIVEPMADGKKRTFELANLPGFESDHSLSALRPLPEPPDGQSQITLFQSYNYGGRWFHSTQQTPNLDDFDFQNRTSSMIVQKGAWQLYDSKLYKEPLQNGHVSATSGPNSDGRYPKVDPYFSNDSVTSLKPV